MIAAARERVAEAYDRARTTDQPAWISLLAWEDVLARLDALAAAPSDLPLYGLPFAIKDNIDLEGVPTTAAFAPMAHRPAARSAFVVQRLIDAGAIPIGKTNMDQFATGLTGTRSPYGACHSVFDERSISGGSSSGSAVAVADGTVAFSLGTDTAGSGRVPAALNGIVGLKPSRGLLSNTGVMPACRSLDCVSVFARDVGLAARVARVAGQYDDGDPYARPVMPATPAGSPPRIGIPAAADLEFCGDEVAQAAWETAVRRAPSLGWEPVEVSLEPFLEAGRLLYGGPWIAERWADLSEHQERHPDAMDPTVARVLAWGRDYSAADAFAAQHRLAELCREVAPTLAAVDALLLPTVPTTFTHEQVAEEPVGRNAMLGLYTTFCNLLDLAAIAVPAGMRTDGLPWGVTLVGPHGSDERLVRLAASWAGEPCSEPNGSRPTSDAITLAVVGAHLAGEPLNHQLTDLGATLRETTRTATSYRLFALAGTMPPKPGLVRDETDPPAAAGIEVELWEMTAEALGRFMLGVPSPLAIGTLELADGRAVKGFLCEGAAVADAEDITAFGGWRAYLAAGSARV